MKKRAKVKRDYGRIPSRDEMERRVKAHLQKGHPMTTLTKYWAILLKARRVGSQPEGYEDCSVVYLASDVDVLVEKFETALRESKAREVPLPSKHYTDEIIALKADLARVNAENEQLHDELRSIL